MTSLFQYSTSLSSVAITASKIYFVKTYTFHDVSRVLGSEREKKTNQRKSKRSIVI
jgi:hypothetical protein